MNYGIARKTDSECHCLHQQMFIYFQVLAAVFSGGPSRRMAEHFKIDAKSVITAAPFLLLSCNQTGLSLGQDWAGCYGMIQLLDFAVNSQ